MPGFVMANYRKGRINDEMQKTLAEVLRSVKDPRVSGAFISITGAEVTADLKYAKIYYSVLRGEKKAVKEGLASSAGYIRGQVARRMDLRQTPELVFIEDTSIAYGAHIAQLLNTIAVSDPAPEEGNGEDGQEENHEN